MLQVQDERLCHDIVTLDEWWLSLMTHHESLRFLNQKKLLKESDR
jgi:hypothetical protein